MSTPAEPSATPPPTDESGASPPPGGEVNAVPAGDAADKTPSKAPGGSVSPPPKSSKPGSKSSRTSSASTRTDSAEGDEGKEGSDAESEYETICIRRKKPTPFFQRIRRLLASIIALDVYMTQVMWEAFKVVVVTSQFNWALEILAGCLHIMISACKCALKKQCTNGSRSDSEETESEKTPEPEGGKKSSVRGSRPSKPGSVPKGSEPSSEPTTTETGETGSTEPTTTETTSAEGETSTPASSP